MPAYSQAQAPFPSEISVRNNVVFTMTVAEVGAGVFLQVGVNSGFHGAINSSYPRE